MRDGLRSRGRLSWLALILVLLPGCACVRNRCPNPDLRPCEDGYAATADGWLLGIRRYRPARPDPGKLPVVLCHGLQLNGTFWTITDHHLPEQLRARGYEVFVVDMRGSGASHRRGAVGRINRALRQTFLPELGERRWTMDDQAFYDVPAIIHYVERTTGAPRVNWIGHSLGGMLMYPFLELAPEADRVATFVAMGATAHLHTAPNRDLLRANHALRHLVRGLSTSRVARPMRFGRPPGLATIDRLYYLPDNVDRRTIDRFYGFTLEDPGAGALRQLDAYLETGHLMSADRRTDYAALLDRVRLPIVFIAAESDKLAPMPSMILTYEAVGSTDKTLLRFGRHDGHVADYGHCDLVWSRTAPVEVFPAVCDWLDKHQPGSVPSPQAPTPQDRGHPGSTPSRMTDGR